MMRKLRIRARLFIGLGFLLGMLIITGAVWHSATNAILGGLSDISKRHYPLTESSREMQFAVVQVQQFFTEASLTRGGERLDEAKAWRDVFMNHAAKARALTTDPRITTGIDELIEEFANYYQLAEVMARLYISGDREGGDSAMIDFNSFAGLLQEKISKIVNLTRVNMTQTLLTVEEVTNSTDASNIIFSAVTALISGILAVALAGSITRPLTIIRLRLRSIIREDVADLSATIPVESHDEIDEVSSLYNDFVSKIRSIIIELADMAEHLASATTQLSATTEQSSGQAKRQLSQINEVGGSIAEVNQAISSIATGTVDVARITSQTHEKAVEGGAIINDASDAIEKLSDYSSKIGNILMVIEDIAKKTDLLAINAAIEAANAGEQGKGFAVVADEVRKLAERTTRATGEISHMVSDIQSFTGTAVNSMRRSNKVMNEIIDEATRVNEMVDQIAAATESQSGATSRMLDTVNSVTQFSEGFAAQADESEKVAAEINEQTIKLQQVVDHFRVTDVKGGAVKQLPTTTTNRVAAPKKRSGK